MAIINQIFDPAKATSTIEHNGETIYLRAEYVGCVLQLRERNYHDDSDFYAVVWDEASQSVKSVDTWTTRFARPYFFREFEDATPEVMAKAETYWHNQTARRVASSRKAYALQLRTLRSEMKAICEKHGIPYAKLLRVRERYNMKRLGQVVRLLKSKPRSDFKKSLQERCIAGLKGDSKYACPLSPKQMQYVDEYGTTQGPMFARWRAQGPILVGAPRKMKEIVR